MKKFFFTLLAIVTISVLQAQVVEKVFLFQDYEITQNDSYSMIIFPHTQLSGLPGEPVLPYQAVSLLLPPGTIAASIEIISEMETPIPGTFTLYPQQHVVPLSNGKSGEFIQNRKIYSSSSSYPADRHGHLTTQYMNGYAFALSTFTPVTYHPATGELSYFRKVTVRIHTTPDQQAIEALNNLSSSSSVLDRVATLAQNFEAVNQYPEKISLKTGNEMLIITPSAFGNSFQPLIDMYQQKSLSCQVVTIETIDASMTGQDMQEKIRNFIIQEYQNNDAEFILLGGDVEHVPFRGFYCQVQSSSIYEDWGIPADLYYSALDGTWDENSNGIWGEPEEDDLLPEIAVTRFPFSNQQELENMIHKTISYQTNPVLGELQQPFMVAEHLYDDPMTFGGPYMDLLIDDQNANGYFTHGIPSAENTITKLYDTLISEPNNIFSWNVPTLLDEINQGKSFIHHVGHSNEVYMMRLFLWDITNQNFSQVNGVDHNYTLMYTHGCLCGAFDVDDCISEKAVTIENWLVGGAFNSRYGWFNEGQTEGPSAHIHREFVSALYNDTISFKRIGQTHMMSKIATAPWVTAPGQWEPGALRWCFYDCNIFGDPAMEIWTDEPMVGVPEANLTSMIQLYPNPAKEQITVSCQIELPGNLEITLSNILGQTMLKQVYLHQPAGSLTYQVSLSGIRSGIYMVSVESSGPVQTRKLIVRK